MKKKEDVFFILYSPQVGSFKGGMSLTLVTFFFETSKLWANIYALVGLECQEARIGLSQAMETLRAPPSLPSTRLGCHNIVHL